MCKHHEPLAFLLVGHTGDDERLLRHAGEFVQFFLHLDVRHHLAADLAETAQAIGDLQKAVFVERGDVAGDVPYQPSLSRSKTSLAVFSGLPR